MQPFAASMYRHLCYVLPLSESTDGSGSVAESFPDVSGLTPVPCRVRLKETHAAMAGMGETALTLADVAFPEDPGVAKGWGLRRQSDGLRMRCLGAAKDRADGRNYVVACEVIE